MPSPPAEHPQKELSYTDFDGSTQISSSTAATGFALFTQLAMCTCSYMYWYVRIFEHACIGVYISKYVAK